MSGGSKPPLKIINTEDSKINKPDSLTKSAAYFKTYTLRDIGEIDQMADSCIIHIDTDSSGNIVKNNSITHVELKSLEPTLDDYGYKNYSKTLAKDIMRLAALTDDSIKSIGLPLNLTDEDVSNPLFDKYYIYSMCNPPPITNAQVQIAIKAKEDAFKYLQSTYSDQIKETQGIDNCIPHKPIVVEAYINGITNAGTYNTIFVSKNGKLYYVNFQESLMPSWVDDQSISIAISMLKEKGNESATNPDFFTYGEVYTAVRSRDLLQDITITILDVIITVPSEVLGVNDIDIPNHMMFGSISSSSRFNMIESVETKLLFLSSNNIHEIDIVGKIMNSGTNIINAENGIICTDATGNCDNYVSVSLRLDETYGLYLERRRTLSDIDSYNSSDDTIDRVLIWDISKYDINPRDDLEDNSDWHSKDVRFPDGEIKHNEFISIGQVMYNSESRKTMKLYIDKLGHIRILLSINPCSPKAEKILKMMRKQYFGGGPYPITPTLNYGDNGKKINGSIYNPAYYNGFIKLHKKTTNATLGVPDRDIVLRLNINDQLSSLNPFNPKKTIYYKLKPEELETDCRNFIHDEKAMMPPNLSLAIHDKENTSLTPLVPSTTISDKTDKTDIRDTCLDICRGTSDCDFAVIQGQRCNLYPRETSKYLINKNDSIANLADNHDVYRKVCMPNTNTSSGTSMAKAGFVNNIGWPMNAVLGENFMILNDRTMVKQFRKEVSENRVELSGKETIEYKDVDGIVEIIKDDIKLENIPGYKATIEQFITENGWPTIKLSDINSQENINDIIRTYYTNIQSRLQAKIGNEMTGVILKKVNSIQLQNNSNAQVISKELKSETSGFANMNIPEYTEVADREKIDSDTRHLDGLLREIRKSINCPYSQPIPDSDSWTDNIFSPEYIALIIIAISLIFILYKIHSRR